MKNFLALVIGLCVLCSSCSDENEKIPPIVDIIVEGGSSETNAVVGDSIFIWSNAPADEQVFDKWTGDIETLANPNEWKTAMKVPERAGAVKATYKNYSSSNLLQETINGSIVYYHIPLEYKGIILPFHGAGGSANGWVDKQLENSNFTNYAIANGYAVVITESKDRINKRWDNTANANTNIDVQNIDIILNNLQVRSILSTNKRFYAVGMSQGGGFASLISAVKNYQAAALYCIPGISAVFEKSTVPVIWNMAENDVTEEPTRLQDAEDNYTMLKSRGVPCTFYVNKASPVNPIHFTLLKGTTDDDARLIYESLKKGNWLDAGSYFIANPRQSEDWKTSIPVELQGQIPDIEDQLFVCYTEHKFYKDSNYRTIQFFNRFN